LKGTRQQHAELTEELILPLFTQTRKQFPALGARGMVTHFRQTYNLKVPEYVIQVWRVGGLTNAIQAMDP
jgi:hypothetical protein